MSQTGLKFWQLLARGMCELSLLPVGYNAMLDIIVQAQQIHRPDTLCLT